MAGYGRLAADLEYLGMALVTDVLRVPSSDRALFAVEEEKPARILDGVWLAKPGRRWKRVDAAELRESAAAWQRSGDLRADTASRLLLGLADRVPDPMDLRHLVVYHACRRIRDLGPAPERSAVLGLGIHPEEADALVRGAAGYPPESPERGAAESVADLVADRRLVAADRLFAELTAAAETDHRLADLIRSVRVTLTGAASSHEKARALVLQGQPVQAARLALRAARSVTDDPAGTAVLLETVSASVDAGVPRPPLEVLEGDAAGFTVRWPAGRSGTGTEPDYRVVRFADGDATVLAEVAETCPGRSVTDVGVPVGRRVRYAVLPEREGRLVGLPLVSPVRVMTPALRRLVATAVPEGVRLAWRAHPSATAVRVFRGELGTSAGADLGRGRPSGELTDSGLPPGRYEYHVQSGFPDDSGEINWSPPERVAVEALDWPEPPLLSPASGDTDGEPLLLTSAARSRGEVRLVAWRGVPVSAGQDVSACWARLAEPVEADTREWTDHGPEAVAWSVPDLMTGRLTALAVLGKQVVAGPSWVLDQPGAIRGLTVRRVEGTGEVEVGFQWPDPCVLVRLAIEQDGRSTRHHVPRSRHSAGALRFSVGPAAGSVSAAPMARPDVGRPGHIASDATVSLPFPAQPQPIVISTVRMPLSGVRQTELSGTRLAPPPSSLLGESDGLVGVGPTPPGAPAVPEPLVARIRRWFTHQWRRLRR